MIVHDQDITGGAAHLNAAVAGEVAHVNVQPVNHDMGRADTDHAATMGRVMRPQYCRPWGITANGRWGAGRTSDNRIVNHFGIGPRLDHQRIARTEALEARRDGALGCSAGVGVSAGERDGDGGGISHEGHETKHSYEHTTIDVAHPLSLSEY